MHSKVRDLWFQFGIYAASIIEQTILRIISPVSPFESILEHNFVLGFLHKDAANIRDPEKRNRFTSLFQSPIHIIIIKARSIHPLIFIRPQQHLTLSLYDCTFAEPY